MWMADPHVISALRSKRAEVAGLIDRNRYFGRGELARLCLEMFRDTLDPPSTPDIVARVIAAKGFDAGDRVLRAAVAGLVKATLNPMRLRGAVEKIGQGRGVRWKLAEREPEPAF
jgi:hypothetical protein